MSRATRVYLEVGGKRTFASAADWPGWSRSGKTEAAALEALAAYAPRYAKVAKIAHLELPKDATDFRVVERTGGNATTDFGSPAVPTRDEAKARSSKDIERSIGLVEASW